jgi:hypothetical protein
LKAVSFSIPHEAMTCSFPAPSDPQLKIMGLLALEAFVFAIIAHASIAFFDQPARQLFVGSVSMASLISMFASPLAVMVRFPKLSARFISSPSNAAAGRNRSVIITLTDSACWLFRVW